MGKQDKKMKKVRKWHEAQREVISLVYDLDQFIDGPPGPGRSNSYPFVFQIPSNLPPSMAFAQDKSTASIRYFLKS